MVMVLLASVGLSWLLFISIKFNPSQPHTLLFNLRGSTDKYTSYLSTFKCALFDSQKNTNYSRKIPSQNQYERYKTHTSSEDTKHGYHKTF